MLCKRHPLFLCPYRYGRNFVQRLPSAGERPFFSTQSSTDRHRPVRTPTYQRAAGWQRRIGSARPPEEPSLRDAGAIPDTAGFQFSVSAPRSRSITPFQQQVGCPNGSGCPLLRNRFRSRMRPEAETVTSAPDSSPPSSGARGHGRRATSSGCRPCRSSCRTACPP